MLQRNLSIVVGCNKQVMCTHVTVSVVIRTGKDNSQPQVSHDSRPRVLVPASPVSPDRPSPSEPVL